jgi:glucose/mannose transport system substrate-binding protein
MKRGLLAALLGGTALSSAASAQDQVEVLHWWTSGGEAAAVAVLKDNLEAQGVTWNDMPVAGGGGESAMTAVRARVTAGNPPTAVQMLGYDIVEWAEQGSLGNLNATAEAEDWAELVPEALQAFATHDGAWVSAPVNVHSTNWVWASKAVMDAIGVTEPPATWDEFIAVAQKAKDAGYVGFAYGGQPWQDITTFDSVALATGGLDWYRQVFVDLDEEAIRSETMVAALERMGQIRALVDDNFSGRDWNLATAMVINDEAAFQIMGDWAKGEFVNAGKVPDQDFLCFRVPGTQGHVTFNADQFAMFDVGEDRQAAQAKMASAIMSPEFQVAFNIVKGSAPARTDVADAEFDACGKKAIADLREADANGTLVGSQGLSHANRAAVKNAFTDAVTSYFNGDLSAEEAAEEMADTVALARG